MFPTPIPSPSSRPWLLALACLLLCACAGEGGEIEDRVALEWTGLVAGVLCAVHLVSPRVRGLLEAHESEAGSFGGGMAVSYVFIHLFAELHESQELFGAHIHLLVLLGFVAYYGLERLVEHRAVAGEVSHTLGRVLFGVQLALAWIYSWLFVFALPEAVEESGVFVAPAVIALALHRLYGDFHLGREHPRQFDAWGRYVLASAPLVGWVADLVFFEDNPRLALILVALLAGTVLYNVFRQELPESRKTSFRWFLTGVLLYVALHLVSPG